MGRVNFVCGEVEFCWTEVSILCGVYDELVTASYAQKRGKLRHCSTVPFPDDSFPALFVSAGFAGRNFLLPA